MIEPTNQVIQQRKIYTVSQLNLETKLLLESHFIKIWVDGEISNFSSPSSGHIYFSLKDENTQVRCAMFRLQKNLLNFKVENGMNVIVQAKVSLYEGRGDYQLIVDYMEPMGEGLLRQAYERLKAKLSAEGLFDEKFKMPIPVVPSTVGIITSPTGAALQDILSALKRRFPTINVVVYATEVQGKTAAASIVNAIQRAEQHASCDVIIIARGGGSLEDLQAFNEEIVARAVFACTIPIVSGVGHEIDTTIIDFVADRRAATPTAAAELVSPDQLEWRQAYQHYFDRLCRSMVNILQSNYQRLDHLTKQLRHPRQLINEKKSAFNNYSIVSFKQSNTR